MRNPVRYFNSSPEVIRLTVMMYIRYPLSLRQVEDLLFERGIDFKQKRSAALAECVSLQPECGVLGQSETSSR